MQAAPTRYVSVSELYSTDEVELLLDEIRELEPTSCRGEDVQDFEIAGSGCGGGGGGGGGRSPAGTELTERSWDSHAQYLRAAAPAARALAPLYCRLRLLRSARGACALLLLACSAGACAGAWAGAGRSAAALPRAARLQLLQLGALSSLLLHAALLALHVSGLHALLPIDWTALSAVTSLWSVVSLGGGGAATLHAVVASGDYERAPPRLARALLAAAALALAGALAAAALLALLAAARRRRRRRPRDYAAVPVAPPPPPPVCTATAPLPSTSRDDPL